ncbi:hypothetical protein [Dapis sp. BLCC M172]|uniref:hypothetical protein n=1 Tax=Dapis sp. BLCC M172 TaxID=2975281 RepID=UPI003CF0B339
MPVLTETEFYSFSGTAQGGGAGATYGMRLSKNYDSVAADLGMTKHENEGEARAFKVRPMEALKQGLIVSLRINFRKPNGKRGAANIYCPIAKLVDAMQGLPGKAWGSSTITSCRDQYRVDYR